jgi:hypothetical protein
MSLIFERRVTEDDNMTYAFAALGGSVFTCGVPPVRMERFLI